MLGRAREEGGMEEREDKSNPITPFSILAPISAKSVMFTASGGSISLDMIGASKKRYTCTEHLHQSAGRCAVE